MSSKKQTKGKKGVNGVKPLVYIRKVILENFLSFQKDEVDFENKKFIIIIGPNWSGKTSIFQAIKFVLGSNERDERYKKWSDFIRHNQKHAMVELHIQNLDQLIKLRRYVIRGHSPYFTIKRESDNDFKKVHANEIQKFISELNYNPDNHFAFVSQGKIDSIKNLRPTELSTFLEEGIGLKGLRDEILQQKYNVLSLNDELKSLLSKKNVLNISLELLEPKLKRLKEKNKLLEIKKGYTDELLWANRRKLQEDIKNLERNYLEIKVIIDEIKRNKREIEKVLTQLQEKILSIDGNINDLSRKQGEKDYKKKELVNKIQTWQTKKINIKQELDNLAEDIEKEEKVLHNYNEQKSTIKNELSIIKKELDGVNKKISDLIQEQKEITKKIEQNQNFLAEYNKLITEKNSKNNELKINENNIKNLNNEIEQLFQSFKDIDHKLDKNKWFLENPSKNLLLELDKNLKKIGLDLFNIESEIDQIEREKFKKISKLKPLQASLRERRIILPSNITILKEEIKKRELNVKGPLIEYLKYDDSLSYAIESVLGEKLLYSFVVDNWDNLDLLKRLKNKYNVYCNIYVPKKIQISSFPQISAPGIIGYLVDLIKIVGNHEDIKKVLYSKIKNCLVVNDYRSGKEMYTKYNFKGKCVTLKGEQIISYKYVYETPFIKQLKGLLSAGTQKEQSHVLESEIDTLNNRITELKVGSSKFDLEQKDLYSKKQSFDDLLYNFNQKKRLTTKKNELYQERTNFENFNNGIKLKLESIQEKIKELEAQKDPEFFKWNNRIKEIPEELDKLNTQEKMEWEKKKEQNEDILKQLEDKINKRNINLQSLKSEFKTKKNNFQKEDKEAFDIYRELENLEDEIDKINNDITHLKENKAQIQEQKIEDDKKAIQITLELEQQNIKMNSIKQELDHKSQDLERIDSQIGTLISENKIKIRSIEEIENDILKIDKDLINYLDINDSILIEKDQIMVGLKEIAKNQNKLEKDINAAIKTENKMEDTYYEKFQGVLNDLKSKINQKFISSNIKSYCSLELEGDFQDLGVVIKAATSKDELRTFTALSGGQISMISICLILSLQEMNPSPLCMLDEAGMFLDENNSEIAYNMIKNTLEQNPIQMFLFLPQSSNILFLLAEKLIGVARVGKNEVSMIFKPKIIKKDK